MNKTLKEFYGWLNDEIQFNNLPVSFEETPVSFGMYMMRKNCLLKLQELMKQNGEEVE